MKNTVFNPKTMSDIAELILSSGVKAVYEHTAWNVHLNLHEDAAMLKCLGFRVRLTVPDIAVFLDRDKDRIELIQPHVPAHEAWLVKTERSFKELKRWFANATEFELMKDQIHDYPHLKAIMYRHTSGGAVQIVWRKKPIYKGLFDKPKKK